MASNPFLMEDVTVSSNPFLSGADFSMPDACDNPFLNSEMAASPFSSSTNPFADFSDNYDNAAPAENLFGGETNHSTDYSDIFSSDTNAQNDFFGAIDEPEAPETKTSIEEGFFKSPPARPSVPPPSLNLMEDRNDFETSQIFSEETSMVPAPPKRPPPPPRPTLPPSKETKDLILSVTGAMDATSSHLLDRLQATRTPSPTPIRDLHTPSPTHEAHFGDLLDPVVPSTGFETATQDLSLFGDEHEAPAPPPRPQRPPEPPTAADDMFDMFGTSHPPAPASNAAILGLFNTPKQMKQEPKADLLSDDFVPEVEALQEPITSPSQVSALDSYPEVNDNVVKSDSFILTKEEAVLEIVENPTSIPDIIKAVIPESFVSNIPETFKTELSDDFGIGIGDNYTSINEDFNSSIHDTFGKTIDDGFSSGPLDTYSETFSSSIPENYVSTIPETFGSTLPDTYTSINENFGTTVDDGFGSSQLDNTYSSTVPESYASNTTDTFGTTIEDTFGSEVSNTVDTFSCPMGDTYSSGISNTADTFGSGLSNTADTFGATLGNTFGTTIGDTFGSGISNTADTFGATIGDTFDSGISNTADTFGTTIGDTFGSGISDTFGSGIPDNDTFGLGTQDTFGSTFGTTIHETLEDTFGSAAPPAGDFDDFAAKFDNIASHDSQGPLVAAAEDPFDPFGSTTAAPDTSGGDAWGAAAAGGEITGGFGADESFDAFLSMNEPPPRPALPPPRLRRHESGDSDEGQKNFSVLIKPRADGETPPNSLGPLTALAPPPKSPLNNTAFTDSSPRFNPFDKSLELSQPQPPQGEPEGALERTDSQETPPTPLFDEDVSQPLEDFPRVLYSGEGWEMHLRQPNKKKITGQRFWKKVFVKLVHQGDSPVLQLYNTKDDKDPFQELPLQACYSVSDIGAQQFDNFGKIFTVKLQYVFYKERPGVRPGQVTKAERITTKLSQFAAYAIQGDYQGCKEFGSDLKKLGLPVEHAPQISQLFKLGCQSFEDLKSFSVQVEECLFRLAVHRDRALNYKTEEVQITAVDELYVEQDCYGHVEKQIARVRLFFLGFLAGMPDVELGVNDMWRQGKEVVGRHDIIPVVTEEWIRLENVEFHTCVQLDEYERTHVIKFKPPDACYLELMRFRIRPPKNRELPLQVKAVMCVTGNKVQLNCDILVPGFSSRKLGQIPCEDIMVRFPIPECWIYLFRVEKHFRYGSVKSTHRRTGKVKGIERFLGAMETLDQSLIEVTSGQAKYEHQHRAIVWRMSRLPKEGQGAYTTHNLVCRMGLTSFDQIPDKLSDYCYVEFTMPATQASHMTVRSVSLSNQAKDDPPEKYVRQLARHEYRVGIEHTQGEGPGAYITATASKPAAPVAPVVDQLDQPEPIAESDSDSSS